MKNLIVLLFAATLGFGMAAQAADAEIKVSAKQEQIKKLRAQADGEHKKGDALTAKADKLESETNAQAGEKMRGEGHPDQGCNDGRHYVKDRGSCTISR